MAGVAGAPLERRDALALPASEVQDLEPAKEQP